MLNSRSTLLLTFGIALSTPAFADDSENMLPNSTSTSETTIQIDPSLLTMPYAPRWQLVHPVEITHYPDTWTRPAADFSFREKTLLARLRKFRNLSLLTLAETRKTRLFFGVNEDGLVGLHFDGLARYNADRHLELLRLPYLKP